MVQVRNPLPKNNNGSINVDKWLKSINNTSPLIENASRLAQLTGEDQLTYHETSCFSQGLEIAEILSKLQSDPATIAAGLIYSTTEHTDLSCEDIKAQLGNTVARLVEGLKETLQINNLQQFIRTHNQQQINNIRKMLLAMVRDFRVVVIKLAERLSIMRSLDKLDKEMQIQIAQATMEIFAPLASRLNFHQIKWELEDLAFYYLDQQSYKDIAKNLAERRIDRDNRVAAIIDTLKQSLKKMNIDADIYGRSKNIYSIKQKMLRKHVDFKEIYDASAVRIIVSSIPDCYTVLSLVHELWQPIHDEFDDYIATPKLNGYQSIHTAVVDTNNKNFEIQIRTHDMQEFAEQGVAAHWMYKEAKAKQTSYGEKITWLRNLLEWQKELIHDEPALKKLEKNIFQDRVYVFTPAGDIIDLPTGATPLDFAYHVHTEVGHRCRGAKISGKIVQLTYILKTGDQVEILTTKKSQPSRDWLATQQGYLKTSSARSKVLQWFKHNDTEKQHIEEEKPKPDAPAPEPSPEIVTAQVVSIDRPIDTQKSEITISGLSHILSRIAKCCKPVPGDPIIGYITQGQGVTIHHKRCKNMLNIQNTQPNRFIETNWHHQTQKAYPVDIEIMADNHPSLIHNITKVLAAAKISLLQLKTIPNKKSNHHIKVILTIKTLSAKSLTKTLDRLLQITYVHSTKRV